MSIWHDTIVAQIPYACDHMQYIVVHSSEDIHSVYINSTIGTVWCGRSSKRFCNIFSGSSPCLLGQNDCCSSAQLPVELSEDMLQNLLFNLPPQTVQNVERVFWGVQSILLIEKSFEPLRPARLSFIILSDACKIRYRSLQLLHFYLQRSHAGQWVMFGLLPPSVSFSSWRPLEAKETWDHR